MGFHTKINCKSLAFQIILVVCSLHVLPVQSFVSTTGPLIRSYSLLTTRSLVETRGEMLASCQAASMPHLLSATIDGDSTSMDDLTSDWMSALSKQPQQQTQKLSNQLLSSTGILGTSLLLLLAFPAVAHAATTFLALPAVTSFRDTGFFQAFSLVFLSEIGDKTFFIAALLAMKTSRLLSFLGSIGALSVMTVLSVWIGLFVRRLPRLRHSAAIIKSHPQLLTPSHGPPNINGLAAVAFLFFGLKTLWEAYSSSPDNDSMKEELSDAQAEIDAARDESKPSTMLSELGTIFGLVFAAELGDRSFLSTIAMSATAAHSATSVALGAIAAHSVATGLAVVFGAVVSQYLSERVIGFLSGGLFLVFALTTMMGF
eukprot:Nitzschia sp. Nitz4//scaffold95_size97785//89322//90592//NITZ4_004681-RA/size97785-augustus-gene-0.103-mRNA-1//1//CDS//3329560514//6555//frame0